MLPWSVIPRAGCPSATAACTRSLTRAAPSSIENSVWVWRWVNDRVANGRMPSWVVGLGGDLGVGRCGGVPPVTGVLHRVWTSYSAVIPTIARAGPARVLADRPSSAPVGSEIGARAAHVGRLPLGEGPAAASRPAGPGPPPAGPPGWPGSRGTDPPASPPAGRGRSGARHPRASRTSKGMEIAVELGGQIGGEAVGQLPDRTARRSRGAGRGWPRPGGPGAPPPAAA